MSDCSQPNQPMTLLLGSHATNCRLTMADHVTAVCRTGYCWLRQLRSVVQSLTSEAADSLVHAFISCRLDYCNALLYSIADALLYGIADGQLQRLQSVQNAAARLVTGTRRTDHITPVLQSLHWRPVRQRVTFKLATLVHKCLNGRAPVYLADDFRLAGRCRPPGSRSAASMMLDIPRTTASLGDRAFAIAGPHVWNSLPPAIRDLSLSLSICGKLLKTYLFV